MRQKAIAEKKRADEAKRKELIATYKEQEKAHYGQPQVDFFGGNNASKDTIWIKHFASDLPLAGLPHPDDREYASSKVWFGPGLQRERNGNLASDAAWMEKARATKAIWDDGVKERYTPILSKLRDEKFWRDLTSDVHRVEKPVDVAYQATYSIVTYKLTRVHVPTIKSVRVASDGLRIVVRRDGGAARDWTAKLDYIRAGFKSAGMDARNLRVSETLDGDIELIFDDRDPLDNVTGGTGAWDDDKMRSLLGIDSHGREVWINWANTSGMVVGGLAGSGKTASMLPAFRHFEGNAELYVFDGKAQRDLHPLRHICRVYDNSGNIAAPLKTLEMLEQLRVLRGDALYSKLNAPNFWNLSAAQRHQIGMKPIFVILDECQVWLKLSKDKNKSTIQAKILEAVENLIRMGRSAGIVVIITTQRPSAESIPTDVRDNSQLRICFKVADDTMAKMVLGISPQGTLDPAAIQTGKKGRFVMDTEGVGMVLGQAGYIEPDELESLLESSSPVPDQWAVAEKFAGGLRAGMRRPDAEDPVPTPAPAPAEDPAPRRLTPEEVRAEAIRLGYLKPDDEPAPARPDVVNETPTDTTKPDEDAAPPHSTTWGDF